MESKSKADKVYEEARMSTKELLDKQKKVSIKIPLLDKDDKEPVPVIINGYQYFIKKGERVEVPESVAKVLEDAGII